MDRLYVERNNIVDRYLRFELSPEEAAEFEQFYMTDPQTQHELESMLLVSEALSSPPVEPASPSDWPPVSNESAFGRFPAGMVAASLMLITGLIGYGFGNRGNESAVGISQGLFIDGALRNGAARQSIGTLCQSKPATISLKAPGPGPYTMRVRQANSTYFSVIGEVDPAYVASTELQMFLSAGVLKPAQNQFELIDSQSGSVVLEAVFDVSSAC